MCIGTEISLVAFAYLIISFHYFIVGLILNCFLLSFQVLKCCSLDVVDLPSIIGLFLWQKSTLSTLKIYLILHFIWFLLISYYEEKGFDC